MITENCIIELPPNLKGYIDKSKKACPRWRNWTTGEPIARIIYREKHKIEYRKGEQVNHTCNNSLCLNIKHLYVGTQRENMKDRQLAGRTNKGKHLPPLPPERRFYVKLSYDEYMQIIKDYDSREFTQRSLAEKYGISQPMVNKILKKPYDSL